MSYPVRRVAIIAAIALAALAARDAAPAHGASFTVNATHDAVDAAPGDGVCADAGGACTLRAAVEETNRLPGADAIGVPAGTYVLSRSPGSSGRLDVSDDLEIAGAGAVATVIRTTNPEVQMISRLFHLICSTRPFNVQISATTISGGLDEGGGGIYNCGNTLRLNAVVMSSNGASSQYGGAIYNQGGNVTIADSLFVQNWAQEGGAIANAGTLWVSNSTVSNNTAIVAAGGIASSGSANLSNVTVTLNTGGGISPFFAGRAGQLVATNTIIANNLPHPQQVADCLGSVASLGHNLASDASCNLAGPGDLNGVQPQLTGLQNNGGPTLTHGLYPNSPAIDAGDNSGCPATDQRGVVRPQGAACDIGAYEYVTPPNAPPTEPPPPPPPPTDPATDTPTLGPTAKPKPSTSPSPSPTPLLNLSTPASTRRRAQPTFAAVLVDAPRDALGVEEDAGGGVSTMAVGLATAGALGLAGSAASAGFFWHRRRRYRRR